MNYSIVVLGSVQDGGYPQIGCDSACCSNVNEPNRFVSCLSILDNDSGQFWLIDITPDFRHQIKLLNGRTHLLNPVGIFLTHAHSGHYTGLIELGREVMNAKKIPVYVMSRMKDFLISNEPWKQLILQGNITLLDLDNGLRISLADTLTIIPFVVPHRGELTETVGYKIIGLEKTVIYLPDIDGWEQWELDITEIVQENDLLFLDGTFFSTEEILHRDLDEIPHPLISKSMDLFKDLKNQDKEKIHFIHLNHTNNVLRNGSKEQKTVIENGYKIAAEGMEFQI